MTGQDTSKTDQWFAMRDLCRPNAHTRAYSRLAEAGFDVFTPLHWVVKQIKGKPQKTQIPVIADLLFVRSQRDKLDPEVNNIPTLQYRFKKGDHATPITVPEADMQRFMLAVGRSHDTQYYSPDEIHPSMIGKKVKIIGGPLNGYEGNLLFIRGSRKKRLIVEIPGFLTAAVEVDPEFITLL